MTRAEELFDAVVGAVEHDPGVAAGRAFGSSALKVRGKIFAMLVKENLVVKLPRERVEEIVAAGAGRPFEPGPGRVMREWVSVHPTDPDEWTRLAEEARAFVAQTA